MDKQDGRDDELTLAQARGIVDSLTMRVFVYVKLVPTTTRSLCLGQGLE